MSDKDERDNNTDRLNTGLEMQSLVFETAQPGNPFQRVLIPAQGSPRLERLAELLAIIYERPLADEMSLARHGREKLGNCTQAAVSLMYDLMHAAPIAYGYCHRSKMPAEDDWHVFNIIEGDVVLDASNLLLTAPSLMPLELYAQTTGMQGLEVFDRERFARFAARGSLLGARPKDPGLMEIGAQDKKMLGHRVFPETLEQTVSITRFGNPLTTPEAKQALGI